MIKIIKIFEVKKPFKPEGKSYTVYSVVCGIEYEGKKSKVEVKAFSEKTFSEIKEGAEINAEKNVYQGVTSFVLKAEKKDYNKGGYNKPSYSLEEFDDLWEHAKIMTGSKTTELDTYFRCATVSGVKVDKKEIVKAAVNGTEVDFLDIGDNDKDSEFFQDEPNE